MLTQYKPFITQFGLECIPELPLLRQNVRTADEDLMK